MQRPLTLRNNLITLTLSSFSAPGLPQIVPDECSAENNTVTIAWQIHPGSVVDGYSLELDDGNEGDFRVSYVANYRCTCTVMTL